MTLTENKNNKLRFLGAGMVVYMTDIYFGQEL
jgi:hypothetical protein